MGTASTVGTSLAAMGAVIIVCIIVYILCRRQKKRRERQTGLNGTGCDNKAVMKTNRSPLGVTDALGLDEMGTSETTSNDVEWNSVTTCTGSHNNEVAEASNIEQNLEKEDIHTYANYEQMKQNQNIGTPTEVSRTKEEKLTANSSSNSHLETLKELNKAVEENIYDNRNTTCVYEDIIDNDASEMNNDKTDRGVNLVPEARDLEAEGCNKPNYGNVPNETGKSKQEKDTRTNFGSSTQDRKVVSKDKCVLNISIGYTKDNAADVTNQQPTGMRAHDNVGYATDTSSQSDLGEKFTPDICQTRTLDLYTNGYTNTVADNYENETSIEKEDFAKRRQSYVIGRVAINDKYDQRCYENTSNGNICQKLPSYINVANHNTDERYMPLVADENQEHNYGSPEHSNEKEVRRTREQSDEEHVYHEPELLIENKVSSQPTLNVDETVKIERMEHRTDKVNQNAPQSVNNIQHEISMQKELKHEINEMVKERAQIGEGIITLPRHGRHDYAVDRTVNTGIETHGITPFSSELQEKLNKINAAKSGSFRSATGISDVKQGTSALVSKSSELKSKLKNRLENLNVKYH